MKRDSTNTAPAEEAFRAAIATARQQNAKSFELHAALALVKLYQNTNRICEARAGLAPVLVGFSPTPEFGCGRHVGGVQPSQAWPAQLQAMLRRYCPPGVDANFFT